MSNESWDVIVVGGGNAALCAALAASDQGARVLVLERAPEDQPGGNSAFTGGGMQRDSQRRVGFRRHPNIAFDQQFPSVLPLGFPFQDGQGFRAVQLTVMDAPTALPDLIGEMAHRAEEQNGACLVAADTARFLRGFDHNDRITSLKCW